MPNINMGFKSDIDYSVGLDTKEFEKERKKLDNQFRKSKISADDFGKSASLSLSRMVLGAGGAVIAYKALSGMISQVTEGVEKFNVQQKAEATLEQTLKATEHAAGLTAYEIKNLASELQTYTTYGDEATIASSALLLTFKQIGEETFPRAQKAILDVSAAMGQDLKSSSIQVGKALNDPIKGMTAMSRVGITFTETQKELVKGFVEANDLASAQGVILTELESQFGGVAEAQAKTFEGINKQLDNYIGDIQEKIGEGFSDEMTKPIQDLLSSLITASPELASLAKSFGSIAGSLISVPTNALTGWIDLFHAYNAGNTSSISNQQIKAMSSASDAIKAGIQEDINKEGTGVTGRGIKKLGGMQSVTNEFVKAFRGNREAMDFVIKNNLLPTYESLSGELGEYTKAVAEQRRVLNISSEQTKKVADVVGGTSKTTKTPLEKFTEIGNSSTLPEGFEGEAARQARLQQQHEEMKAIRMREQEEIDAKSASDFLASMELSSQHFGNIESIVYSSENAIMSIHEIWASDMLSIQAKGMSSLAIETKSILSQVGQLAGSGAGDLLGVGSSLLGGLGIAGAGFSLIGGLASLFESDNSSDSDFGGSQLASSQSQKANIVSSGPETVNIKNVITISAGYISTENGLDNFVEEELSPRIANGVRGALV
ncbi:MAG: hypothetical protein GY928_37480 [Colwellia sp.]|nr:hypothetical protein [Colwellia sp.]